MAVDQRGVRTDRRRALRREAILEAAAAEFAEHGYEGATLDRIGDRIGLSKATLYYYVSGKPELLATLLEQVTDVIAAEAEQPPGAPATDRLRAFIRAHVRAATVAPQAAVLAENLDALMARSASAPLADVRHRHEDRLASILRAGIESGEFTAVNVGPAVKLLFGALNGVPRWYDPHGALSLDALADQVVDMVLTGLADR